MENIITIKKLDVSFNSGVDAIKELSADIKSGQITGLIGPSGAGKTTLIRAIVGRQKITKGEVRVLGHPAGASILRSQMSYMTQEPSIYADLTLIQNLTYFGKMYGLKKAQLEGDITKILNITDMSKLKNRLVSKMSGGQKQRVSLAISLIGFPKLMILDEPTVGLDPVLRQQIWQLFRKLCNDGTTIVITSHVMDEAEKCDDLLLIRDGKLLIQASPISLKTKTSTTTVEAAFLKLVDKDRT